MSVLFPPVSTFELNDTLEIAIRILSLSQSLRHIIIINGILKAASGVGREGGAGVRGGRSSGGGEGGAVGGMREECPMFQRAAVGVMADFSSELWKPKDNGMASLKCLEKKSANVEFYNQAKEFDKLR